MGIKKLFFGFLILILFLSCNFKIKSVDWLITTSGNYILDDDIFSTGDATNGTIRIQSSYVNLDLNGREISQSSATASCNGIQIDAGVGDVKITNGYIKNFTRAGIVANAGCNNLLLQNLIIDSCQVRGIDFNGTSTITGGTNITESSILNCKIINSSTASTADFALSLSNCSNLLISDCVFSKNGGAPAQNWSVIGVTDTTYCSFIRLDINSNSISAHNFVAINLNSISSTIVGNYFLDCIVRNNSTASTALFGFSFATNSEYNVLDGCQVLNNSGGANLSLFFNISGNCHTFRNCIADGNFGATNECVGFALDIVNSCVFLNCISSNNRCTSGDTNGFRVQSAFGNVFLNCAAIFNYSPASAAEGFLAVSGTPVSGNQIINCDFMNNTGNASSTSYGISLQTGTSGNAFLSNNCAFNGTTGANQTSGVNAGAVTSTTSITSASATSPWATLQMPT